MSADITKNQTEQERAQTSVINAMNQLSRMRDAAGEVGMNELRDRISGILIPLREAERLLRKKEGKS